MPPKAYTPRAGQRQQSGAAQQPPRRMCPACQEDVTSAADLVEIEVRKRGKPTGTKLLICKECNRRTIAVLALIEPHFPEELHIYTE